MPRSLSRLQVDRVSYLLQEIYGIENKNNQETKVCACGDICWGCRRSSLLSFPSTDTEAGSWRGLPGPPALTVAPWAGVR